MVRGYFITDLLIMVYKLGIINPLNNLVKIFMAIFGDVIKFQ